MKSDAEAQRNRPPALKMLISETMTAACAGVLVNKSCIIGDACARMPIPAVTLIKRIPQSRKNCGVLTARFRETLRSVIIRCDFAGGVQPEGFQPSGGRRR